MILVCIDSCELCSLAVKNLPQYEHITLSSKSKTVREKLIKKKLFKLNPSRRFPVMFSDDLNTFYPTNYVLDRMKLNKILQDGRTN